MPRCEFVQQFPKGSHLKVLFDAKGTPQMIGHLSEIQEILTQQRCHACIDQGRDPDVHGVVFDKRTPQTYVFYGMKCLHPECGARLEFGQRKEESGGGLYVKRWDKKRNDGKGGPIPHNGWEIYRKEEGGAQPAAQPATQPGPRTEISEDEIPFSWAVALMSAGLLGSLILASQDLLQVI